MHIAKILEKLFRAHFFVRPYYSNDPKLCLDAKLKRVTLFASYRLREVLPPRINGFYTGSIHGIITWHFKKVFVKF